ncbi:MAG TPA: ATP-binding cassette domain-containing protein [Ohtaekwangia sp.]|nr:ATP-binding cassette domain-containing protein [Ohtaekwangia sp.]
MSEELLKAIVQLFAIVARERITDDERTNIKEFLALHLNREATAYYLKLFDEFCHTHQLSAASESPAAVDTDTQQFIDDWSNIMKIIKQVNRALTMQQKLVLVIKIIELIYADHHISERQANLIFYIGQALKIPKQVTDTLTSFVQGQDIEEFNSRNILVIDEGSGDYEGPRLIEKNLTGLIAILRLPEAETYFIKYLGITTLYLNSIILKSRKIDVFPTGSTIRGDKVGPIYYSDIIGKFLRGESTSKITFTADHLFYHFRTGRAGLQNVNIAEQGGKLIGIMGGSGSGKSTLLNVLNGVEKPSSGRVLVNGIDIHENSEQVNGIIGYVPQDDLLMEDLTVFENLYYAAKLCFGHYTEKQIIDITVRVLFNLGLTETRDLKVGSPLQKTISGGQRKRLNIGLELLREPTILFVDEPTSGLSSRDSENIMDLLKELSLRGKMVFVVIHQPSSDIFKMFDTLMIMDVGGFQIYYGNPIEAVTYFREIINAANRTQGACPECGNINPEQIFSIIETKVVNEYGRLTNTRKVSPGQWYQYFKQKIKIPRIDHVKESLPVTQEIPGWAKQFKVFVTRDVLSKFSNRQYLLINLMEAPVLAFFIAFMVKYYNVLEGNPQYTFYNNDNIPVYFFMSVVVALFFGLTMSAEEIFRDRKILKRERFLHLSRSSYLSSKVFIMFGFSAIQTLLFILVGNAILEIPLLEMRYWLIVFSCSCFANMLGLNISSAFDSAVTIYILIPLLVIPQLLLSGVVISFEKFNPTVGKPVGIPVAGNLMASRWAFEAFMVTQFKDNPHEKQFYALDKVIAEAEYKRVYYIPVLESELANCLSNRAHWRNPRHEPIRNSLALLQHEIQSELQHIGDEVFPAIDKLVVGKFDSAVHWETSKFLNVLKAYYGRRMTRASTEREHLIDSLTATPQLNDVFEKERLRYVNRAVTDAVKNTATTNRIVEYEGKLIRKIYPIYMEETKPDSWYDFSANLFQPVKHFAGQYIDTLYFNIAVIWSMTLFLFITLYFNVLRLAIKYLGGNRKHRKKDKI